MTQTDVSTALTSHPATSGNGAGFCPTDEDLVILRLIAEGLPLDSVARHVAMSSRTVRRRLRSLCDQFGVAHPIQAIVWAARRGLI
jgi:DNA-binding NarL/FixJ family response regulator